MSDAIDRALSENHALIAAILEHHSSGRHVPAVALLERLQLNLEFIAALSEQGVPTTLPVPVQPSHPDISATRPLAPRIAPALPVHLQQQPVGTMYWTPDEHARFEQAMTLYGQARDGKPNFKAIASYVGTRTPVQVRSHLQKVQKKARKDAEDIVPVGAQQLDNSQVHPSAGAQGVQGVQGVPSSAGQTGS